MEMTMTTDAMPLSCVHVARAQSVNLLATLRGTGQGTGVSASVSGGQIALRPFGVVAVPAFYAAPKSLVSDVAYVRTGSPPV